LYITPKSWPYLHCLFVEYTTVVTLLIRVIILYYGRKMAQTVRFEKIVSEGKALAHWNGKALFVAGALPGETAVVRLVREKPSWAEGVLEQITEPSSHRGAPQEAHYLSCSPWQGVAYDYQLALKRDMLAELFAHSQLDLAVTKMVGSPHSLGYRNKLEFALMPEGGDVVLAQHVRGTAADLVAAREGCVLGTAAMNELGRAVAEMASDLGLAKVARRLTLRQSHTHGGVVAVLELAGPARADFAAFNQLGAQGMAVLERSTAGAARLRWSYGQLEVLETIAGMQLVYPWQSFFQVNLPAFELALTQILAVLKPGTKVVDLYGGVGSIGLPAARVAGEVVGVEIMHEPVALANRNAELNGLSNYRAVVAAAEAIDLEVLTGADTIVVDPPRAGLDPKVVELLLASGARRVVYLSCNPVTQARDIRRLAEAYSASAVTGFDFYPGTLHVESLVVLTRR